MIGYVFTMQTGGFFGILTYGMLETTVLMRIMETTSVSEACTQLGKQFAGTFKPADLDQQAWGKAIFKAQGGAQLLTDR